MDSIVKECGFKKQDYERCFNEWFSMRYLTLQTIEPPVECDRAFREYQDCIRGKLWAKLSPEQLAALTETSKR